MLAKVDFHALFEVVYTSVVIVVLVSFAFAALLYGAVRSADAGREGHSAAAFGFALMAFLGTAVCTAIVGFGFYVITKK